MSEIILQLPNAEERVVPLCWGETYTLGRDVHHAIAVDDRTVSRLHARLMWQEDGGCIVEDMQSSNGTTLNNALLIRPERLQDGDRLRFGRVTAIYQATDVAVTPERKFTDGDILGSRYRLEKLLGETDEYETFRATDTDAAGAAVAVTIFNPEAIAGAGGFGNVRRQFARVCALSSHPGLVRLLEFARWRGIVYLATEWVNGPTLLDLLRRHGSMPLSGALRLTKQVAAVTDHARAYGLPMPDLSPRAVLVASDESHPTAVLPQMFDGPVESWPVFTLKIIPRLFAPAVRTPWPLGTLLCDLLGHPPTGPGKPPRIACLGERGNMILTRGFALQRQAADSDSSFVTELADAVGLSLAVPWNSNRLVKLNPDYENPPTL